MTQKQIYIRTYHIKHRQDYSDLLSKAKKIAEYAVEHKNTKKLSSKNVKEYGVPAAISNQILRKYGNNKNIQKVSNVNLVVPNQITTNKTKTKVYHSIKYKNEIVTITPLKKSFRWNPGKNFLKINQIEIDETKYMIAVSFNKPPILPISEKNLLGVDLNCGIGRHIANCANLTNGHTLDFGRNGPNIRKQYSIKRKKNKIQNNREKRKMRDLDHKISNKIVKYALKEKLKIVLEDLSNIRNTSKKGEGSDLYKNKNKNRVVNSWSFYRLQQFIEYKAEEHGIPVIYINPHYTSRDCSYCGVEGLRDKDTFKCKNKRCKSYRIERNSDKNAAFNIAKKSLLSGSIVDKTNKTRKGRT